MKAKVQLIEKEVKVQGDVISITEELDRDYKKLTGIAFLDNNGVSSILQSSSVNGKELFPKNFETAFLQSGINVPPDERFFTLYDREAAGNKIEITFVDGGAAPKYPYTIKIYLRLESDDKN